MVRRLSGVPFVGENTAIKWFRMDAVVKTDMPDARVGLASIESPVYGHVLWMCQDHGRTRIGFSLPPKMAEKYGNNITEAEVRELAKDAMAPFSLEIETLDWWTLYRCVHDILGPFRGVYANHVNSIGQRVADTFRHKRRVFLAGDASHSHSSGAGQGMNAGAHDALNLSWKLGGFLKGWYDESILDTYEQERRPEAQRIIDQDKTLASLITGKVPEGLGRPGAGLFELLGEFIASTMRYTLGLDVHYQPNVINQRAKIGLVAAGWPGPDVLLRRPGSRVPVRLHQVTKNVGRFHVLVFTGNPAFTIKNLVQLRSYLDSEESFTHKLPDIFNFLTIIPGDAPQSDSYLGVDRFGKAFYDNDQSAACKYGFSAALGGIVVLRPDGTLGYSGELGEGPELGQYFSCFVKTRVAGPSAFISAPIETESKAAGEIDFDTGNSDLQKSVVKIVPQTYALATGTAPSEVIVPQMDAMPMAIRSGDFGHETL